MSSLLRLHIVIATALLCCAFDFGNSLQFGFEYDDNVYKTFSSSKEDALFKLLGKSDMVWVSPVGSFGMALQLGGKKYLLEPEQDTAIGQFDLEGAWRFNDEVELTASHSIKGQIENSQVDALAADINEDYISNNARISLAYPSLWQIRHQLQIRFNTFTFFGNLPVDFYEERFGIIMTRPIAGPFSAKLGYELSLSQFPNSPTSDRRDHQHEVSAGVNYYGPLLLSMGYAYLDNSSSQSFFSSTGHRVTALASFAMHSGQGGENEAEDVTLHLLASLQIRQYPAVFITSDENQRLLFSDSEDNNFNTLTVKVTKRITKALTGELKYSRYSNELSDREAAFSRSLLMAGFRTEF